ncbi:trimeric intracellular cation channel family protein [Microbacterium sp. Marseille-Q6965]|uniref:trimeric intracellular cation channel family protein n=1 Tax=Microbacterium sp. Marseille-Q6965 TaxID=2965072 RepID=UPI0021B7C35B|nr:TRIC cation channel family protein [Microbacterium sp. Marseille-Q6965]
MDAPLFVIPLWADLLAVALGGIQGAVFASGFQGQRRLDWLGVAIIGIMLGMGGGLIRDILLGVTPATLQSNWYLVTAVAASLTGMLLAGVFQRLNPLIVGLDAVAMGLFGAVGTSKALAYGLPIVPAVFIGMCAAVGGGIIRDIAMGLPVAIMHVGSLYAIAALAGGAVLAGSYVLGADIAVAAVIGAAVTALIRLLAVIFDVSLPEQRRIHRRKVALETSAIPVVTAEEVREGAHIPLTGAIVVPDAPGQRRRWWFRRR